MPQSQKQLKLTKARKQAKRLNLSQGRLIVIMVWHSQLYLGKWRLEAKICPKTPASHKWSTKGRATHLWEWTLPGSLLSRHTLNEAKLKDRCWITWWAVSQVSSISNQLTHQEAQRTRIGPNIKRFAFFRVILRPIAGIIQKDSQERSIPVICIKFTLNGLI